MHTADKTPDKALFTPGPLTTSATVKHAMLRDLGSRDAAFLQVVEDIRRRLRALGGSASTPDYEAVLLQGSGTYAIEAVLTSAIPRTGKLLVAVNGAYGERMVRIAERHDIACHALRLLEHTPFTPGMIDAALTADPAITTVALVHCETTTGLMNPAEAIGAVVRRHERTFILDAMSSFGAVPLDVAQAEVDYLVSSANKCIEGVPGFAFVLCRRAALEATAGWARTLCLDLRDQWRGLERDGQFRFTPPTHALLAFQQALVELEAEGGVAGRAQRYRANHALLTCGMRRLGFREYIAPEHQSYVITAFRYPADSRFDFAAFYALLNEAGCVIYPGKLSHADCFRIGSIGRLHPPDFERLLAAVESALQVLGIAVPVGSHAQS